MRIQRLLDRMLRFVLWAWFCLIRGEQLLFARLEVLCKHVALFTLFTRYIVGAEDWYVLLLS